MKKILFILLIAVWGVSVGFGGDKEQCIKNCQKSSDIAQCITEKCDISKGFYNNSRVSYVDVLWGIKGFGFYEFSDFLENSEKSKH